MSCIETQLRVLKKKKRRARAPIVTASDSRARCPKQPLYLVDTGENTNMAAISCLAREITNKSEKDLFLSDSNLQGKMQEKGEGAMRVPLRDQTNEVGYAKRARLGKSAVSGSVPVVQQHVHTVNQGQQNQQRRRPRLEGEEFKEWQAIWRRTMRESVIYFYGDDGNNSGYKLETEKLKQALKLLGASISPFFDSDVTIIISRKPYDDKHEYRPGHVFHSASVNGLKVWTFEKLFRFLKNLGAPSPQLKTTQTQDLSVLLTQERLHGPIDRDFSLRRDDFHYFKGLYFYCFDLRQVYRPVAVREWMCKNHQDEDTAGFPQLYASTNGRCPFQDDPINDSSTRKRLQRMKYFEENKEFREKLMKASRIRRKRNLSDVEDSDSDIDDSFYKSSSSSSSTRSSPSHPSSKNNAMDLSTTKKDSHQSSMVAPPALANHDNEFSTNTTTEYQSHFPISNQNAKFFEIQASGMNNQSTAISQSKSMQDFGNNGLAPSRAEVLTKSFKDLNRKVTRANKSASLKEVIDSKKKKQELKQQQVQQHTVQQSNVSQPKTKLRKLEISTAGYCESCRLKYDDFDLHINSTKHRSFAMKDSNFEQIDNLIRKIHDTNILHS